jgi:hypothetical protein
LSDIKAATIKSAAHKVTEPVINKKGFEETVDERCPNTKIALPMAATPAKKMTL